ncbi:GD20344 [Drosophila simulans]|uniref:GD20344 n=1 Tax=Drosophila simulans TaxID=7240 RepID=B4QYF8_DROSI|nr:GD20344 [Drosophila simulans]
MVQTKLDLSDTFQLIAPPPHFEGFDGFNGHFSEPLRQSVSARHTTAKDISRACIPATDDSAKELASWDAGMPGSGLPNCDYSTTEEEAAD